MKIQYLPMDFKKINLNKNNIYKIRLSTKYIISNTLDLKEIIWGHMPFYISIQKMHITYLQSGNFNSSINRHRPQNIYKLNIKYHISFKYNCGKQTRGYVGFPMKQIGLGL